MIEKLGRFIPVVGVPHDYRAAKEKGLTETLEYKLVWNALNQTSFGGEKGMGWWHVQGLYVITPSGKLLSGSNDVSNPARTLAEMEKGLEAWAKLSKEERLLPRAPDPKSDRVARAADAALTPEGGLVLRMVSRGLPMEGVTVRDTRHPSYYKLDRLWYTREEARRLLPAELKPGAKHAVPRGLLNRLALLYLGTYVQPNLYWHHQDVILAELSSEIVENRESASEIRLQGRVRMKAEGKHNHRAFEAELLGKALFDSASGAFSAFELVVVGNHTMGPEEKAPEKDAPSTTPLGLLFTLNGANSNDAMAPHFHGLYAWASAD